MMNLKRSFFAVMVFFIGFLFLSGEAWAAGNEFVDVDTGGANKGYVTVKVKKDTVQDLRVRISKGEQACSYVLMDNKKSYKFPLQMGSGTYTMKILENTGGNKYANLFSAECTANITDELAPFKISHVLINYDAAPNTVGVARDLVAGKNTDLEKLEAVYGNVVDSIRYDHALAGKITSGAVTSYIPDVDQVYASKKGICFDYSSVMASMLRSQGVPTRMVFGYVAPNNLYHAWNEVYITTMGWVKVRGELAIDGNDWSRMDATFAASSGFADMTQFIGNGQNYKETDIY